MNITEKTGKVVGMLSVTDSQDLIVMTQNGILIRQPIRDIRVIGRNTQGVKLIRLEAGDQIADITTVAHHDDFIDDETNDELDSIQNQDTEITEVSDNTES